MWLWYMCSTVCKRIKNTFLHIKLERLVIYNAVFKENLEKVINKKKGSCADYKVKPDVTQGMSRNRIWTKGI